jgi:amino acid transporter
MTATKGPATGSPAPVLRRTLTTWGAISLSIAAMGASLAVNINPQGAGATVGRAVPLTFILATIGVVLVAYGFARVCGRLSHAGSVFGLTGVTIGPRAGVVAGWSLLGAYFAFTITTSMTAGIFGANFLQAIGLWQTTPTIAPWLIALFSVAVCLVMAISPVKRSMRTLLWVEVLTASLIVLIGVVVFIRVAAGHAPQHQPFTLNMFTVPPGVGTSTLFLGIVFGFLSFAGFEAAATLGEEAADPRRAIPRAIFGVALFGGVFYTIGTAIEMLGFGTTTKGVAAFASSSSLFGTLGAEYVTPAVGDIVTLGTTIAAIGCCLATLVAAARLLFAMSPARRRVRVARHQRRRPAAGHGTGPGRVRAALPDRADRGLDRGHRHRRPARLRPVLRPGAVPGGLVLPGVWRLARLLPGAGRAVDRLSQPAGRSGAGRPGACPGTGPGTGRRGHRAHL